MIDEFTAQHHEHISARSFEEVAAAARKLDAKLGALAELATGAPA